ncbi:hypothetical protein LTR85_011918 [Meristemomyces frigidus]|nr:hypothetical protein LTR85_011918 [Meristemomyces frigidus]
MATVDAEKQDNAESNVDTLHIKRDKHGLPLIPQPTEDPLDPLNWKAWIKVLVLFEVSAFTLLTLLSASMITPSFQVLSRYLHTDLPQTAYITSIFILFGGCSAVLWNPIANVYGRRPVYLVSIIGCVAFLVASGAARSYSELMAFRALNGFFSGVPLSLGSATVCDMFFEHERGRYLGIYTLSLITGGHLAPVIGGYIEKDLTWRWCFYISAMLLSPLVPLCIFTLPETLYPRNSGAKGSRQTGSWKQNFMLHRTFHRARSLHPTDFLRPWQMLRYPSVLFPTLYYSASFAYGSIMFVITSASFFSQLYHFKPYQTGLLLGIPLTVGSILGEVLAGGFSDWISERRALQRGGKRILEDRLLALAPAIVLLPLGIILEGVCIQHSTHWSGVGMGIGIASFGLQVQTTVVYAYTAECYKEQAADIGLLLSLWRAVFSFSMGFYALRLGDKIGFQDAWIAFAFIIVALSAPAVALLFVGEKWRHKLGPPHLVRDF